VGYSKRHSGAILAFLTVNFYIIYYVKLAREMVLFYYQFQAKIYPSNRPWRSIELSDIDDRAIFRQSAHRRP
jgi:hypothetical protein